MQRHAHHQGSSLTLVYIYQQRPLRGEGCLQGLGDGREGGAESVTHRFEDETSVGLYGASKYLIMAG